MNEANKGARWEGYIAYFRQAAPAYVPPAMLPDLPRPLPDGENPQALLEKENKERVAFFIRKSLEFVRAHTSDTYDPIKEPGRMEEAALYAQWCFGEQYMKGEPPVREPGVSEDVAQNEIVAKYHKERQTQRVQYIASLASEGRERFAEEGMPLFLEMLRHDLAFCERAILDCPDYSNISTGSGDEYMKTLARGRIAAELWGALHQLQDTKITEAAIVEGLKTIREKILNGRDMKSVANAAFDEPNRDHYHVIGSLEHRLTIDGVMDYVKSYPFRAPTRLSTDKESPTRFSALEYHYRGERTLVMRADSEESRQYYISGLKGWRFSRDASVLPDRRSKVPSDVFEFTGNPGDEIYLWKPPHTGRSGTPDFTIYIERPRRTPARKAA